MLLWVLVLGGLALAAAGLGLFLAMSHAERRARRTLFRTLGLDEATVSLLMARNGDVLAELALVRRRDIGPAAAGEPPPEPPAVRAKPAFRLVHPTGDAPPQTPPAPDPFRPAGDRRRLRLPGRHGRP